MKTVVSVLEEVGDWAIHFLENQPQVVCKQIQVDEMWGFVGYNEGKRGNRRTGNGRTGVVWLWLSVCKDTGLVLAHHIGTRHMTHATTFMKKVAKRLKRAPDGSFMQRPTIVSDGWRAYQDAVELAFGEDVDFGVYEKIHTKYDENGEPLPSSQFKGAKRKQVFGTPDVKDITTWRIERENGYIRQANRRYTRKANACSKSELNHARMLAIEVVHRNYCWHPNPKRPRHGGPWKKRVPAAMAAGMTDHIWERRELIEAADAYKKERLTSFVGAGTETHVGRRGEVFDFWVNHSPNHRRAKVHVAACTSCNGGTGKKGKIATLGEWLGFATLEAAQAYAELLEPDNHSICKICVGSYNTLFRFGRRL